MRYVWLTKIDGMQIAINTEYICTIAQDNDCTLIFMAAGPNPVHTVLEKPSEIFDLIGGFRNHENDND